jgi:hypothetical protein
MNPIKNLADASKPGAMEAIILEARIRVLWRGQLSPKGAKLSEQQHEIFKEVCDLGVKALNGYDNLAESPAAHVLLEYLKSAFLIYLEGDSKTASSTSAAQRNGLIARSFGASAKSGPKITVAQRMKICSAFSLALHEQTVDFTRHPTQKEMTQAARKACEEHYGEAWQPDDEKFKKRLETIRVILRDEGHLPKEDEGGQS